MYKRQADEQALLAGQERREAEDRHAHADRLDPDVDEDSRGDADADRESAGERRA